MNMAYVASRFAADRRRPGLSFSHHAELAGMPPEDQELWLDRAEAGGLSVRALRIELRKVRRRTSERMALARARLEPPAPADDVVVCPHCGHRIEA